MLKVSLLSGNPEHSIPMNKQNTDIQGDVDSRIRKGVLQILNSEKEQPSETMVHINEIKDSAQIKILQYMNTKLFRLFVVILFFMFISRIIVSIMKFFDIDEVYSTTYIAWISILAIFWAFLPEKETTLPLKENGEKYNYMLYLTFAVFCCGVFIKLFVEILNA